MIISLLADVCSMKMDRGSLESTVNQIPRQNVTIRFAGIGGFRNPNHTCDSSYLPGSSMLLEGSTVSEYVQREGYRQCRRLPKAFVEAFRTWQTDRRRNPDAGDIKGYNSLQSEYRKSFAVWSIDPSAIWSIGPSMPS
jgi:hypothetical protein